MFRLCRTREFSGALRTQSVHQLTQAMSAGRVAGRRATLGHLDGCRHSEAGAVVQHLRRAIPCRQDGARQVRLRVRIAEVSRSTLNQFGVNLNIIANPGSFAFQFVTGAFLGATLGSTPVGSVSGLGGANTFGQTVAGFGTRRTSADLLINALQSEGMLTLLAEPNLTTLSGETASFMAGGKVPIPLPQSFGVTTIDYKRYGVQLQFTPTLLAGDRIAMRVQPEVSEISSANSVTINGTTVSSFINRRAQSNVEMVSGQTLAIAGLLQRNEQANISRFRWLSDIPILGALFRSVSYQRNETKLVILVTSYLSVPVGSASRIPSAGKPAGSDIGWVRGGLMRPVLFAALLLGGCAAPAPALIDARGREVLPVAFVPGTASPVPSDTQRLLALRRYDGPALLFQPPGQLAPDRAYTVARVSGRSVQIAAGPAALGPAGVPDKGVLIVPGAADIALDPCLGLAGRGVGGILPGSERSTPAMLPPGCATERMLRA